MTTPRVLVSGASIAGLCTAFWMDRIGWQVTVIERAPAFRDGGQNVDVRGVARAVLDLMGLQDQVRARSTTEEGTCVVDDDGRVIAAFPVEEADGPTAELEILRGDLARTVLEALPPAVQVRYADWVDHVQQDGTVHLHSGAVERYDLVVIAEGVRSATRDLVFGEQVQRHRLGLTMAYGTIARSADDDRWWRWYVMDGGRQVTLRPDSVGTTRATLAFTTDSQRRATPTMQVDGKHTDKHTGKHTAKAPSLADLDLDAARTQLARTFAGGRWQTERVVDGFARSQDVYVDDLTQIKMTTWSQGRVCLVGDAAWCVTPLGGGGTSLAMTGGYVLAAYLSQHRAAQESTASTAERGQEPHVALSEALGEYERWMRPVIDKSQKLPPGTPSLFYPRSRVGVRIWRAVAVAAGTGPLRALASRLSHVARTDQQLPQIQTAGATA